MVGDDRFWMLGMTGSGDVGRSRVAMEEAGVCCGGGGFPIEDVGNDRFWGCWEWPFLGMLGMAVFGDVGDDRLDRNGWNGAML